MPGMIGKLFEEGELTIRSTSLTTGSTLVRNRNFCYILTKESHPCHECNKPSNKLDICSEAYFCGEVCKDTFYTRYNHGIIIGNMSENIADSIIEDILDRRGLNSEWYSIDEDIQEEIRNTWATIAYKIIQENERAIK